MHLSVKFFLFYALLVLFFNPMRPLLLSSLSETKLFEQHSLPHDYLTFLGDSHLQNGGKVIALTKEAPTDGPRSTGMVLYNRPIMDSHLKKVPSFSTKFAFSIRNRYRTGENFGDGLAFFISPDNDLQGSPGFLGLANSSDLTKNKFIAIEFDAKYDPIFQDPDDNHLGLDINSLSSVQLATSLDLNLKSGDLIYSWIDYKNDEKRLEVFLSDSDLKPIKPLMKVEIDLSNYLKKDMFVGFSAATETSMQLTHIEQWEFTIVEFSPPPVPSPPPVSGRTFPNPSESGQRRSHFSRLAIGLTIGVCLVPFVLVIAWFCWKDVMGMIQRLERTNNLEMQTVKPLGGSSEIRLSIPDTNPDEVARGLIIEQILDNEAELIRVKTVKFSIRSVRN